jgi:hypothetical protein
MIYLVVFILLAALAVKFDFTKSDKRDENFWYYFALIIFIAVSGLRYKVGGDSISYIESFNDIPFLGQLDKVNLSQAQYDPLWIVFSSVSKSIVNDFVFFQIIHAIFINFIIFRFIKQNTVFRFTAVLLYYLFFYMYFNMEIMRESLAVCVFLLAYPYLKTKKWVKFYICAAIAFLFHSSAIILFIFPFLRNVKFKPLPMILLVLVFFVIIYLPDAVKTILGVFIFNERLQSHFEAYSVIKVNSNGVLAVFVIYLLAPGIIVYLAEKKVKTNPAFKELYFTYFFLAVITLGFAGFARFINYLTPFMAIYFANLLNWIYRNTYFSSLKRITVMALIVIAFLPKLNYYFTDTSNIVLGTRQYDLWFPYNSVFFKEENYKREELYYGYFSLNDTN